VYRYSIVIRGVKMAEKSKEVKKITAGLIFSWIFGVLFFFAGLGVIVQGAIIMGLLVMLCSILIIPLTNKFTKEKMDFEISGGVKWILVILIFIFIAIGASSNKNSTTNSPSNNAANQQAITPTQPNQNTKTYGIGDSLVAGDFTWKITDVSTTTEIGQNIGDTFIGEKANGVFVILSVEVKNTGKSAKYLSDSYIKLIDDQNREFSASTAAAIYMQPQGSALMFEQLNPGITKNGKVVFDVPQGLKVANVKITSSLFTTESYTIKINIP